MRETRRMQSVLFTPIFGSCSVDVTAAGKRRQPPHFHIYLFLKFEFSIGLKSATATRPSQISRDRLQYSEQTTVIAFRTYYLNLLIVVEIPSDKPCCRQVISS